MREALVENHLGNLVYKAGGMCVKLSPMNYVGIPDRMILLPGGRLVFVECKKPKRGKIAKIQGWWRDRLIGLGFEHRYVFTKDEAKQVVEEFTQ